MSNHTRTVLKKVILSTLVVSIIAFMPMLVAEETTTPTDEGPNQSPFGECSGTDIPGGGESPCGESESTGATPTQGTDAQALDPIDILTGNSFQRESDYAPLGYRMDRAQLTFTRYYNSLSHRSSHSFGNNWSHTYQTRVVKRGKDGRQRLVIIQADGRWLNFWPASPEQAIYRTSDPRQGELRIDSSGGYEWSLPDQRLLHFRKDGQLSKVADAHGGTLTLKYTRSRLTSVHDHQGRQITFSYSHTQQAVTGLRSFDSINATLSNEEQYYQAQGFQGRLIGAILPNGRELHYHYNREGMLNKVMQGQQPQRQYRYDNTSFPQGLTAIVQADGQTKATWDYDHQGRVIDFAYGDGSEHTELRYEWPQGEGTVGSTWVTNALGQESRYQWQWASSNQTPLLLSAEGPGCNDCPPSPAKYEYNKRYQLTRRYQPDGSYTRIDYDPQGRAASHTHVSAEGEEQVIQSATYEGNSTRLAQLERPSVNADSAHRTHFSYDGKGRLVRIHEQGASPRVDPLTGQVIDHDTIERTSTLGYSDQGQLLQVDGPRTDVDDRLFFSYNEQQQVNKITFPDGLSRTIDRYNADGLPTKITQGQQAPTLIEYNQLGKPTKISQNNTAIEYRYDDQGQLTHVIDPDGNVIQISYTLKGDMHQLIDDKNRLTQLNYNDDGRLSQLTQTGIDQQLIQSLSYVYDAEGRLQSTQDDQGNQQTLSYDVNGRLQNLQADNGQQTNLNYGPFGQLLSINNASNNTQVSFDYDAKGQAIALSDPNQHTTQHIKDDFGRTVALISPDSGITTYAYNEANQRIAHINAEQQTTQYHYDAASRTIKIEKPEGETLLSYDPKTGQLSQIQDQYSTDTFAYNDMAQLVSHQRTIDNHSFNTRYSYNAQNKLKSKTLPDGTTLSYHYYPREHKDRGQLRAITQKQLLGEDKIILGEIDLDPRDGQTHWVHANGIVTDRYYDAQGKLEKIEHNQGSHARLDYQYNDQDHIVGMEINTKAATANEADILASTQQYTYEYEGDKLSNANTPQGNFGYQHDALGNRLNSQAGSDNTNYTIDPNSNRLLRYQDDNGKVIEITYNKAGSPLTKGNLRYEYNSEQRPIKVFKNDQLIAEYRYNSFGERIKKVAGTNNGKTQKTTYYLYDGQQLIAEANDEGSITDQYLYLGHQPIAHFKQNQIFAIHSDHLGTPIQVTDVNQQTVWSTDYTPYGEAVNTKSHTVQLQKSGVINTLKKETTEESYTLNLRFPGQYYDQETGTHYNYFRDYDPKVGRYLTSDPIGVAGGLNTYAYVTNNPVSYIDSIGLNLEIIEGGQAGDLGETLSKRAEELGIDPLLVLEGMQVVPKPAADSPFVQKLDRVLKSTAAHLRSKESGEVIADLVDSMRANAPMIAGMIFTLGAVQFIPPPGNAMANLIILSGLYAMVGTEAVNVLWTIINTGIKIHGADINCTDELDAIGVEFGEKLYDVGLDLLQDALLAGFAKIGTINRAADGGLNKETPTKPEDYAYKPLKDGYEQIDNDTIRGPDGKEYDISDPDNFDEDFAPVITDQDGKQYIVEDGNIRERTEDEQVTPIASTCSFHGATQVLTAEGYQAIKDLRVGQQVWSRDAQSGAMDWKWIEAQYSNQYEETVSITLQEQQTGNTQTIVSNRIHPFFAVVTDYLRTSGTAKDNLDLHSSEGHDYQGNIANGYWIDAEDLKPGYRLLNSDESWSQVIDVKVEPTALEAYNLTVSDFHTYFVKGGDAANDAQAVWVHNDCINPDNLDDISAKLDNPQPGGTKYNTTIDDGKVMIDGQPANGTFDFVITETGELRIGNGHYHLSDNADSVKAAGEVYFENGKFSFINNGSGHYQPTVEQMLSVANELKRVGLTADDFAIGSVR